MWNTRNASLLLSILLLSSLSLPLFSASESGSVTLSQEERKAILSELNAMKAETQLLRSLSEESKADSAEWQNKCARLEEKLTKASQELESSEKSVIELREEVRMLRSLLDELKKEFNALNQSYSRQKKKTSFWRTASIVLTLAAVIEGGIIWLK